MKHESHSEPEAAAAIEERNIRFVEMLIIFANGDRLPANSRKTLEDAPASQ